MAALVQSSIGRSLRDARSHLRAKQENERKGAISFLHGAPIMTVKVAASKGRWIMDGRDSDEATKELRPARIIPKAVPFRSVDCWA